MQHMLPSRDGPVSYLMHSAMALRKPSNLEPGKQFRFALRLRHRDVGWRLPMGISE